MNSSKHKKQFRINIDSNIAGISKRTMEAIINEWYDSDNAPPNITSDLPKKDEDVIINLMQDCLKEEAGEISRQARVVHLALIYINLNMKGKGRFLGLLAKKMDVDTELLDINILKLRSAESEKDRIDAELSLRISLIPPRVKLLQKFINLPNGFIFLKDMRRDLLPLLKCIPRLQKLDYDLKQILISYFDVNLLDMREINWNSQAATLEKLMEYEAVHDIHSWKELKHRLFTDRRVYAFFHNKMPNDPLIFVEVAFVNGMADSIQKLLDAKIEPMNPDLADTAIFYSISSTQKGLKGISFGNFLIKRVVKRISNEFKNIKTFATLSPIPRFIKWLHSYLENDGDCLMRTSEIRKVLKITNENNPNLALLKLLSTDQWYLNEQICKVLKRPLSRLCTHYLVKVKFNGKAFDSVANFHLSNGAKIQHLRWLGDTSRKGIERSAGFMVNYHYRLNKIVDNHENYFSNGSIYASREVSSNLR